MAEPTPAPAELPEPRRSVLCMATPRLWPLWPFLPLVRQRPGGGQELGVLFDALHACGLPGHSATVFLSNLIDIPPRVADLLALPKEVFDSPDEVAAAGWRVDLRPWPRPTARSRP
jgi:hypothetical protein